MDHSHTATTLVERFEGCVLHAYPDPGIGGDPWTIGWGATGPGIAAGVVWTQAMADDRLNFDLSAVDSEVTHLIGDAPTTQNQFDALVSFTFNVGAFALGESTLLKMHRNGDFAGATAQFPRWNRASGRVLPGLTARRTREAALYAMH